MPTAVTKQKRKEMSAAVKRVPLGNPEKKPRTARKPRKAKGGVKTKFGMPVVDATDGFAIPLLEYDVEKAQKDDPGDLSEDTFMSCVIAQAVTRAFGAERVWIGRKTAYVAFPGDEVARRYEVSAGARKVVEAWDKGEEVEEGVEVKLNAPAPRRRLETMRENWDENSKRYKAAESGRKQSKSDPLHNVVRNGNLVRWQ